jgi:hypothetical protein
VDPRELLPLPVSEGPAEEGPTPSPVVCPAGLSSTCTSWGPFTKVAPHDRSNSNWLEDDKDPGEPPD